MRFEVSSRRMRLGRWLPWVAAAAILTWLLTRVSGTEVLAQLGSGPHLGLLSYIFMVCALVVATDAWATRVTLRLCGVRRPLAELVLVRGALNVAGLVHLAAVQVLFGVYLRRHTDGFRRTVALVALLAASQMGALLVLGSGGMILPVRLPPAVRLVGGLGAAGFLAGALLLRFAGPWLARGGARLAALAGEIEAGRGPLTTRNVLAATAVRVVHAAALAAGLWGGLRLWGIDVPFTHGMALMPWTILAAFLPITPGGIGTTQAAMVWLFTPYASESAVLTLSLLWTTYGLLSQGLIGLLCSAALPWSLRPPTPGAEAPQDPEPR